MTSQAGVDHIIEVATLEAVPIEREEIFSVKVILVDARHFVTVSFIALESASSHLTVSVFI